MPKLEVISPSEFFSNFIFEAIGNQNIEISDYSSIYLINLLLKTISSSYIDGNEYMFDIYLDARTSGPDAKRAWIKLGDASLILTGLFFERISTKINNFSYYKEMGKSAYYQLSKLNNSPMPFIELSNKYDDCIDILREVSDKTNLRKVSKLEDIYFEWIESNSKYEYKKLISLGIIPTKPFLGN